MQGLEMGGCRTLATVSPGSEGHSGTPSLPPPSVAHSSLSVAGQGGREEKGGLQA